MLDIPTNYWVAGALAVIGLVGMFWNYLPSVGGIAGSIKKALGGAAAPTNDRKQALAQYDDCIAFLESIGCKQGVEHLKAGLVHFYHEHAE